MKFRASTALLHDRNSRYAVEVEFMMIMMMMIIIIIIILLLL